MFELAHSRTPAQQLEEKQSAAIAKVVERQAATMARLAEKQVAMRIRQTEKAMQKKVEAAIREKDKLDKLDAARLAAQLPAGIFDGAEHMGEALAALETATEVSLDLETTSLTKWSVPITLGSSSKLGNGLTVNGYIKAFGGCTINNTPRARILSFCTQNSRPFAFDLDGLNQAQQVVLIAALHNKIWIGHNLSFDLGWLRTIVPGITPSYIIDTLILGLTHTPEFEFCARDFLLSDGDLYETFGHGESWSFRSLTDRLVIDQAKLYLIKRDMTSVTSDVSEPKGLALNFLSMMLLHEKLDKGFQRPKNWMPSVLSVGHKEYCIGDINQPPKIARLLVDISTTCPTSELISKIKASPAGSSYDTMVMGMIGLATMQQNGMQISRSGAVEYKNGYKEKAEGLFNDLIVDMPLLQPFKDEIMAGGRSDEFKNAFDQSLFDLTGIHAGRTEAGAISITAPSLKMLYPDLLALKTYIEMGASVKKADMADSYMSMADNAGRVHSLVTISAITCRTSSQEPNVQNIPRGQDFRALFTARAGYKIIASDYAAIEMRIAAALTVRAYQTLRKLIDLVVGNNIEEYIDRANSLHLYWLLGTPGKLNRLGGLALIDAIVFLVKNQRQHPDAPPATNRPDPEKNEELEKWAAYYVGEFYKTVMLMWTAGAFKTSADDFNLTLLDVFKNKLDPHVITALATEAAGGRIDLCGMLPIDYIAALTKAERDDLKIQLKQPRQSAKAQNFGLLYGMAGTKLHAYGITNYGLSWTPEEAESARGAWFLLYPEIRLWHLMTQFNNIKIEEYRCDHEGKKIDRKKKIYVGSTLSGRALATDKLPSALNFQDQGTGAEIALSALGNLPADLQKMLVNFVHDEYVLEVPEDDTARVVVLLEKTMIDAADTILKPFGVSTEVETAVGDHWIH